MLGLFTFIATWTNFFWPFIVLDPGNPTLPVALQQLQAAYFVDYSLVLAGVVLAAIPLLILLRRRRAAARVRHHARSSQGMTLNLTPPGRPAKPAAGAQDSPAGTRKVPDGLRPRRRHRGLPDRGRPPRGRAHRLDLGHLLAHPGRGRRRRHRRHRLRPLPPVCRRRGAHEVASACSPTASPTSWARVCPDGGRSTPQGPRLLRAARRLAPRRRDRAVADALPLGPARRRSRTGAAGPVARDGRPLRRLRPRRARPARRPGRTWTTLNEPWCSAFLGYTAGMHAPGRSRPPTVSPPRTTSCSATAGPCRRCAPATPPSSSGSR